MTNGFANNSGMDLFGLFINNFDIQVIYELGWYAAQQWMFLVTGVVTALAIGIRMMEEQVVLIGEGKSGFHKATLNIVLVAGAIGLYFTIVHLVITFFNAIYGALDSSDTLLKLTKQLDGILASFWEKDFEFAWSDIVDSAYAVFATGVYAITYCMLVFMVLAMRVAHAMLVSFCVFWGAVALPMSITTGFKMLAPWRTLCLLALFWPIVDSFCVYLIGGSFSVMLDKSGLGIDSIDTWSMGTLLFYMAAFSIINIFLAATTMSAPIIAQAVASGNGNITGMLGAFGGAGIAAGVLAGRELQKRWNSAGGAAGAAVQRGGERLTPHLENAHSALHGNAPNAPTPVDTSKWFRQGMREDGLRDGASSYGSSKAASTPRTSGGEQRAAAASPQPTSEPRVVPTTSAAPASAPQGAPTPNTAKANDLQTKTTRAGQQQRPDIEATDEDRAELREKRRKQGQRGAVIQRQKKLKDGK